MPLITENFQGADIIRLNKCIKAIHAADLQIGSHTQAGINQLSGNVWVWDEDWAGCIYCTIGMDVSWLYSCPECGAETDFDTYEALKKYVVEHDDKWCEECPAV